ncbi:hypothetical protein [Streptomyces qinglanensis]|nr:hypothetical protein [Streptomyces qinglanensis]
MYRSAFRKALGGIAVVGSVAAMSLAGSTAAAASTTTARPVGTESHARSPLGTRSLPDREAGYRGTQGFNLCLLSRCSIGSDDGVGSGIGLVQGGNLCLLSTCEVRP